MLVRLYHYPATRSARVAWLLHELEPAVTVEIIRVDLYRAQQFESGFAARFPLHAVPAIEILDGTDKPILVTESGAIITLLADAYPDAGLAPLSTSLTGRRADYINIIHQCSASFDMMLWQIRSHTHILAANQRDTKAVTRYREKFTAEAAPILAKRLEQAQYICGDSFSAADCMVAHVVMWARSYDMCRETVLRNYLSRVSKRPAFLKAFADAGDFSAAVPDDAKFKAVFNG